MAIFDWGDNLWCHSLNVMTLFFAKSKKLICLRFGFKKFYSIKVLFLKVQCLLLYLSIGTSLNMVKWYYNPLIMEVYP